MTNDDRPEPASDDPLVGRPLADDEQRTYAAWSARIEADDYRPDSAGLALEGPAAAEAARDLLDGIIGAEALDAAIGRGRPSLDGTSGNGPSPKRQVRLPRELDARLQARADAEHRRVSDVMREAIEQYLRAS